MNKLGIRILGIDGVLGYDSIGLTLREYIRILTGKKSDRLTYSRSFSCNSSYLDVKRGDVVIVLDNDHTSLAVIDELYTEEDQADLSPTREIIAKVDLSDYVYSQRAAMEREDLYNQIQSLISDSTAISIVNGELILHSEMDPEIQELIDKYNNTFCYEKAFVGKARLNRSSVNSMYDPAIVGKSRVGRAIVDILKS